LFNDHAIGENTDIVVIDDAQKNFGQQNADAFWEFFLKQEFQVFVFASHSIGIAHALLDDCLGLEDFKLIAEEKLCMKALFSFEWAACAEESLQSCILVGEGHVGLTRILIDVVQCHFQHRMDVPTHEILCFIASKVCLSTPVWSRIFTKVSLTQDQLRALHEIVKSQDAFANDVPLYFLQTAILYRKKDGTVCFATQFHKQCITNLFFKG
jgi:hypothetical protein